MNEKIFAFEIEGTSAILMHRFNGQEEEKRVKELPHGEQAEHHAYRHENGNLAVPGEWIRGALINAFVENAPNKQKMPTKRRVSPRILVEPILIDMGVKEYEIDIRSAPCGNMSRGGTRDIVVRPIIKHWKITGRLHTGLDESREMAKWLAVAGEDIGIGSNRVNGYGRFAVTSFLEATT